MEANADDVVVTYVVYGQPRDFPNSFVVRRWRSIRGAREPVPDPEPLVIGPDLGMTRTALALLVPGLYCLGRDPDDDPKVVEVWI